MPEPTATVCIPWRPSPARFAPFRRVMQFWNQTGWRVVTADSDTRIFNLSMARNNAVRKARTNVVIVADADTIPPMESVMAAVRDPVGVTWPHERWVLLPGDYADKPYSEFPNAKFLLDYRDGLGGVVICTREEYWRLGGMPEEFFGWGFEDCAFNLVANTLSIFRRIGGTAYSIDHTVDGKADSPGWDRMGPQVKVNRGLIEPYLSAADRPWLMREVLRRRDLIVEAPPENDPLAGRYKA